MEVACCKAGGLDPTGGLWSPNFPPGIVHHRLLSLCSRVRLLATPWTAAYQATTPSMGFSRQEYWSGVPLPSPMNVSALGFSAILINVA